MVLLFLLGVTQGCLRSSTAIAPVPLDTWTMRGGGVTRAAFADQAVPLAPTIAWRSDIGRGLETQITPAGSIALVANTASRTVYTLDPQTGARFWERRFNTPTEGAPLIHGGRVYFTTSERSGDLNALDLAVGRNVWTREVGQVVNGPVLVGDTLFVATLAGTVSAVAADDGQQYWRVRLNGHAATAPVPAGRHLLVPLTSDSLFVLDRADGRVSARYALPATVSAPIAIAGDIAIIPLHSGDLLAFSVADGRVVWRAQLGAPVLAAPAVARDGSIYALTRSAELWRVTLATGDARRLAALGGAATGSMTLTRDGVLVGRLDGSLTLVGFDGVVRWEEALGSAMVAPVTVTGGAVFIPLLNGEIVKLQ